MSDFCRAPSLLTFCALLVCALGCDDGDARGDVVCSSAMECQCPGTGDCQVDCRSDCDLSCTGSGDCDFICAAGCETSCPGSGECLIDVGDEGSVSRTGSGGCDVVCHGDCTFDCPGSGDVHHALRPGVQLRDDAVPGSGLVPQRCYGVQRAVSARVADPDALPRGAPRNMTIS